MRLLGLIFDNLGLKLLALVMAWAVWFMTREGLTEERVIWMDIKVVVVQGEDEVVARATPEGVKITVTGTARAVADFDGLVSPVAVLQVKPEHFPPTGEWNTTETFVLRDLQLPESFDRTALRAKTMDPNVIEVKIDRIEVREFPVEAPPVPTVAGSVVKILQPTTTATVRGTMANLESLGGSIKTTINRETVVSMVKAMGSEHTTSQRIELDIDPVQQAFFHLLELVEPDSLAARVKVSNVVTKGFTVPVRIFYSSVMTADSASRTLRFAPVNLLNEPLNWNEGEAGGLPTMSLRLRGSPVSMAKVDRTALIAFVIADDMPAEDVAPLKLHVDGLPVGVSTEGDVFIHVQIDR